MGGLTVMNCIPSSAIRMTINSLRPVFSFAGDPLGRVPEAPVQTGKLSTDDLAVECGRRDRASDQRADELLAGVVSRARLTREDDLNWPVRLVQDASELIRIPQDQGTLMS
jgi:hypothetical protein